MGSTVQPREYFSSLNSLDRSEFERYSDSNIEAAGGVPSGSRCRKKVQEVQTLSSLLLAYFRTVAGR